MVLRLGHLFYCDRFPAFAVGGSGQHAATAYRPGRAPFRGDIEHRLIVLGQIAKLLEGFAVKAIHVAGGAAKQCLAVRPAFEGGEVFGRNIWILGELRTLRPDFQQPEQTMGPGDEDAAKRRHVFAVDKVNDKGRAVVDLLFPRGKGGEREAGRSNCEDKPGGAPGR